MNAVPCKESHKTSGNNNRLQLTLRCSYICHCACRKFKIEYRSALPLPNLPIFMILCKKGHKTITLQLISLTVCLLLIIKPVFILFVGSYTDSLTNITKFFLPIKPGSHDRDLGVLNML